MPLEMWSERVAVVHLSDDPQFTEDLASFVEKPRPRADVVLDFAAVTFLNSTNMAMLLRVRKETLNDDTRLVLCGISTHLWGTFLVTSIDKVFTFAENVPAALATLQLAK